MLTRSMRWFVGDLIEAVEARNEPSVVVFYGDHLPTMGLKAEDLKYNGKAPNHRRPYGDGESVMCH